MRESVLEFGPAGALVGVLTQPERPTAGAPAVLILNAGLIHRIGPNRLHVSLARRLAKRGFTVLRFDFAGVGDSHMTDDGLDVADRALADIRAAMNAVEETTGHERFVTMGLCSGAFASHLAAVADERVVGCAQLDGYVYPTRGYYLRHYGQRLLKLSAWAGWLRRRAAAKGEPTGPEQIAPFAAEMIPRERFEADVGQLVERGVALLFVLTRGGLQPINYSGQLQDCVPSVDLSRFATVVHYPAAAHTFTLRRHREELMDAVEDWLEGDVPRLNPADAPRMPRSC